MKSILSSILISIICLSNLVAQPDENGHRISISVDGWTDSVSYLGYYIGGKTFLQDTALVKNGRVVFEGEKSLVPGMYFLYTPNSLFFEFLVNENEFALSTEFDSVTEKMRIEGSRENELFFNYQKKLSVLQGKATELNSQMENLTGTDSLAIINELTAIRDEVTAFQRSEREKYVGTYYSEVLSLILRPELKSSNDPLQQEKNYRAYKAKFWEGTDFKNPGTLRNPIFESKTNEYFDKLVVNSPDSVIAEIEGMLAWPMDSTVFRFLVVTLTNRYANSKVMGMDAVYVHMVDNYYRNGRAYWIDEATLGRMIQNSDRFKPILIGKPAPVFRAEMTDGSSVSNPFTVTDKDYKILFFYDSGCGHCKKAAPILMEAFTELQKEGISADVISMNLSEDKEEWNKFLEEFQIKGKALGDPQGISNAGYFYYIDSTPQIYILDRENKIIAKKISAEYIDDFIRDYIEQL